MTEGSKSSDSWSSLTTGFVEKKTIFPRRPRKRNKWRSATFVVAGLCMLLGIALMILWMVTRRTPTCADDNGWNFGEKESERNVFSALQKDEIDSVLEYMWTKCNLNLTSDSVATLASNFIHSIELMFDSKKNILEHLDNGAGFPVRRAKAFIFKGAENPPMVEEYVIGDLPNISYCERLSVPGRKTKIPYHMRPFSKIEFAAIHRYILPQISKKLGDILLESYGALPLNCGDKCLEYSITPISSGFLPHGTRKTWFWFSHGVEFATLHPLDIQFLIDMTDRDGSKWVIEKVWYHNQLFSSMDDFIQKYNQNTIAKTKRKFPDKFDYHFSTLSQRANPFPEEFRRPPTRHHPDGLRYTVDGNKVKYMLWQFHFHMSVSSGLQLLDIRFDNERILYELGMQEVSVMYSGYNPSARRLYYVDSAALFGTRARGLMPGVDCPEDATFIDVHQYTRNDGGHRDFENAVCVFEHNTQIPIRRHRTYRGRRMYGGMVDTVLTVRYIISVINYDYIYDYIFHQNGGVEVKVSSTGYLGTTVYFPEEQPYGPNLHGQVSAGMHNHLFHFKADLDIKGTKNRFETLNIVLENKTDTWKCEYRGWHVQTRTERSTKLTEQEALYHFNFDTPKYLLMTNNDYETRQGLSPSYRLLVNGMSKQLIPSGYGFENSVPWARYQVAVTKQKDDEITSSSIFAMWDARDPVVDFENYVADDEEIVDEDLVAWITLGTQHIPQTENLPTTATVGGQLSFFLLPYNYFEEDPSMRSKDSVYISPKNSEKPYEGAKVERFTNIASVARCPQKEGQIFDRLSKNSTFLFS